MGIIHAVGLIASRAAAADAAERSELTERNKQNRRIRPKTQLGSVRSQIFVALNGRKRGRKTPGTDLRSPKRKKKWKRGGSRSCFRQSQLIDRRIEWLFLLHFTPPLSASVTPDRGAYLSIFLIVLFSPLPLSFPPSLSSLQNLGQMREIFLT